MNHFSLNVGNYMNQMPTPMKYLSFKKAPQKSSPLISFLGWLSGTDTYA